MKYVMIFCSAMFLVTGCDAKSPASQARVTASAQAASSLEPQVAGAAKRVVAEQQEPEEVCDFGAARLTLTCALKLQDQARTQLMGSYYKGAIQDCEQATKFGAWMCHRYAGMAYERLGQKAQACEKYRHYLSAPERVGENKGKALKELEALQCDKPEQPLVSDEIFALDITDDDPREFYDYARQQAFKGNRKDAVIACTRGAKLGYLKCHLVLARLHVNDGAMDKACHHWQKVWMYELTTEEKIEELRPEGCAPPKGFE